MTSDPLGTRAAANLAGVTYRQVDYWCRREWIRGGHGGSGTRALLPGVEVEVLLLMARMVKAGLSVTRAAHLARLSVTEHVTTLPLGGGLVLLVGPR